MTGENPGQVDGSALEVALGRVKHPVETAATLPPA